MKANLIPAFLSLLAGACAIVLCIVQKYEVLDTMIIVLIALIVFDILGIIFRGVYLKWLRNPEGNDDLEMVDQGNNVIDVDENGVVVVTEGVTKDGKNDKNDKNDKNEEDDW